MPGLPSAVAKAWESFALMVGALLILDLGATSFAVWWHDNRCALSASTLCTVSSALTRWWWSFFVFGVLALFVLHLGLFFWRLFTHRLRSNQVSELTAGDMLGSNLLLLASGSSTRRQVAMARIVFFVSLITYVAYFSYCVDRISSVTLGAHVNQRRTLAISNAATWASWVFLVGSIAYSLLSEHPDAWLFKAVAIACTIPVYICRGRIRAVLEASRVAT